MEVSNHWKQLELTGSIYLSGYRDMFTPPTILIMKMIKINDFYPFLYSKRGATVFTVYMCYDHIDPVSY